MKFFKLNKFNEPTSKTPIAEAGTIGMTGARVGRDNHGRPIRTEIFETYIDGRGYRKDRKVELDWDQLGVNRVLHFMRFGDDFEESVLIRDESYLSDEERSKA